MRSDEIGEWPTTLIPRQRAFLERYSRLGSVAEAADGVCNRITHYKWVRESDEYCQAFEIAKAAYGDQLLSFATRLATEGELIPISHRGKIVTDENGNPVTRRRYDRTLLRHLMALHRDRWLEDHLRSLATSMATQGYTFDANKNKKQKPFWKTGIPIPDPQPKNAVV